MDKWYYYFIIQIIIFILTFFDSMLQIDSLFNVKDVSMFQIFFSCIIIVLKLIGIIIKYLKLDIIEYYTILDYSNAVSSLISLIYIIWFWSTHTIESFQSYALNDPYRKYYREPIKPLSQKPLSYSQIPIPSTVKIK